MVEEGKPPFHYEQIDMIAQEGGVRGLDLLPISARTRNALYRSEITTVAQVLSMRPEEITGLRNIGSRSLRELQEGLDETRMLSVEQLQERAILLKQPPPKPEKKPPLLLPLTEKIFNEAGQDVLDDVRLFDLIVGGSPLSSWLEHERRNIGEYRRVDAAETWYRLVESLPQDVRRSTTYAFKAAIRSGIAYVGDIRRATFEELCKQGGSK